MNLFQQPDQHVGVEMLEDRQDRHHIEDGDLERQL
jgi:hypothetical protein